MKIYNIFLSILFFIISFSASAQRTISGRITEAEDGNPIPGASVFIDGTKVGISSDTEGFYKLIIPGPGSYTLSVSHAGYKPVFKDIEPGKSAIIMDVEMNYYELEEVSVTAKVKFRKQDINLFWDMIFGEKPSKKTIFAVNPGDVFYFYNRETNILTVTSRIPIQIFNLETGYHIEYLLKRFTHNYNTNETFWEAKFRFTELEPVNIFQENKWEKNREKVNKVSIYRFVKSLYDNSLDENGFQLSNSLGQIKLENYLSIDSVLNTKTLYIPQDSTLFLICYGKPAVRDNLFFNKIKTPNGPVQIFPDGTFKNPLGFSPQLFTKGLTGLNMFLPLEYNYNIDSCIIEEPGNIFSGSEIAAKGSLKNTVSKSPLSNLNFNYINSFNTQFNFYTQEKVYLHFDNTSYYQGDNIFFKCYVVTSEQNQLSELSKTLYVELLNPGGEILDKRILKIENGQCHGDFSLNHIPFYSGYYEVRAYTKYMLNFGEDVIFSRVFPVFDKQKIEGDYEEKKMLRWGRYGPVGYPSKRENPQKGKTVNLSFFPEGGNLVQGIESCVAFEATDETGNPIDITGFIINNEKQELCKLATLHEGRGIFTYTPGDIRKKDIAEVEYSGKKYRFDLPQSLPQGIVMEVDNLSSPDSIIVNFRKNSNTPAAKFGVAVISGGILQNSFYFEAKDEISSYKIDKTQLPSGVSRIVLFNSESKILCDRLVFTINDDVLEIKAKTNKQTYKPYELVEMEFSVEDKDSNPVNTTFSLSIRDGANEVEYKRNILTDLLLTSEIKGYVRDPSFYFEGIAGQARNDRLNQEIAGDPESSSGRNDRKSLLDLLLMVQGWRRYSWEQITANETQNAAFPQLKYLPEQGIETQGTVVSFARKIPKPKVDVSLSLRKLEEENTNSNLLFETFVTDSKGRFNFVLDIDGKWDMILSAMEKKKKTDHRILLDRIPRPEPKRYKYTEMQIRISDDKKESTNDEELIEDFEEDSEQINDSYLDSLAQAGISAKIQKLPEVKITAKQSVNEQDIIRSKTTSVAYYDAPSEMDDIYDSGKLIGKDIHKLLMSMNKEFYILKPMLNVGITTKEYVDIEEFLYYRGKKVAFVEDYNPTDLADFGYISYLRIPLNAIKSIYINENRTIKAKYLYDSNNPFASPFALADAVSCVIFIETFPNWKKPFGAGKGLRKTWLEGYSQAKEFYSPNYSAEPVEPNDYRRTLYWNPMVETDENGIAKINFYNNSNCKNFIINAETVTEAGMIGVLKPPTP